MNVLNTTLHMALSLKRPHGSTEEAVLATYMAQRHYLTMIDGAGNLHFDLRSSKENRTLFTAHTDTVHRDGGVNTYRIDGKFWRGDGDCLGADDGAGVALLAHMMSERVPGYYILFRGEECGGIGSSWLAENMPDLLAEFDRAVAFDRAGYYDVITHQSGGRCCSDKFADALANQLADAGLMYAPCDGGVYTDTAEFVDLIPECTNLSVGYKHQHSEREEQDVEFLGYLAEAVCKVQWDNLPVDRDPAPKRRSRRDEDAWDMYLSARYSDNLPGLDDADLDAEEAAMVDAINLALDAGNMAPLHTCMATALGVTPAHNLRVDYQRLDTPTLQDALSLLRSGFSAEEVAAELYDTAFYTN